MSISRDMREWCDEADVDGNACDELRAIADRIDREIVELPKDADGEPIRIGDVVYGNPGIAWTVVGMRVSKFGWKVEMDNMPFLCEPDDLSHKKPEQPDSWENLEKDARKTACDYAPAPRDEDGLTTCDGCPFLKSESCRNEMTLDLVKRAKKLAGIEEGGAE